MHFDFPLPIDEVLPRLRADLARAPSAVLVAPPGAGKTTRVPLAIFEDDWVKGRKILVLEPRRLAARGAAERMASSLGEKAGERVGLKARLITQSGPRTRIEVITEGVFTRLIQDDPSLEGIAAVLFDEFHERSLDADLGLALALDAQSGLREDLRILIMSATLDGARVARLLGADVPVIESKGRSFPVETRYLGRDDGARIEDRMCDAILRSLRAEHGSILAFLPGQAEIRRLATRLAERLNDTAVDVCPLYGAMDMRAQKQAVEPAPVGRRKIVLATSIAESSLTIEGVTVVIDSGLARVSRYEADAGVTRLVTQRVSRASADQRRGRAGRTAPGVCYRLWQAEETASLPEFAQAEIRSADLAGLLLDCAAWGVSDVYKLSWLDPPPRPALDAARTELLALDALDADGRITVVGESLRALPLPPRLAHMLVCSARAGLAEAAAEIAAVLVERGLGGNDTDLERRLEVFRRDRSRRAEDMRRLARGWASVAAKGDRVADGVAAQRGHSAAEILALAFPDRIAKARGTPGQFLLANGRGARLEPTDPLASSPFLVVAEMAGAAAATRILLAARLDENDLPAVAGSRITEHTEVNFDKDAAAVRARRVRKLDAITLASEPQKIEPSEETAAILADGIATLGIARLPWTKSQLQLRARVAFLRAADANAGWPGLGDPALGATCRDWLGPFLAGKTRLADIGADDLGSALATLLPWDLQRRLEAEAPTHFTAPTGNAHPIDYESAGAPALHIRVQELYGLAEHPAIAAGRLPLTLHLLSPAHRPIQITRDLPGFWRGSWSAVKADMKGQYPKHLWPDDPLTAAPTSRAKPRK